MLTINRTSETIVKNFGFGYRSQKLDWTGLDRTDKDNEKKAHNWSWDSLFSSVLSVRDSLFEPLINENFEFKRQTPEI